MAKFKGACHLPLREKLGWVTSRIRCEIDAGYETCSRGSRSQAGAIFLLTRVAFLDNSPETIPSPTSIPRLSSRGERSVVEDRSVSKWMMREESAASFIRQGPAAETSDFAARPINSIQPLRHRNLGLAQHMLHLRLPQARSVILKRQFRLCIVQVEFPQSISIRKFAQFL